jgi:hypothetical protein
MMVVLVLNKRLIVIVIQFVFILKNTLNGLTVQFSVDLIASPFLLKYNVNACMNRRLLNNKYRCSLSDERVCHLTEKHGQDR